MATLTRSGVCYNLSESPFVSSKEGWLFYFSSHTHLLKFEREADKRMEWLTDSLSQRFHVLVKANMLALIQLYMQVEKRGFMIVIDGCAYGSPDDIGFCLELSC